MSLPSGRDRLTALTEHQSYLDSRQAVEPDFQRADELFDGITWQISRDPLSCPAEPGTPFLRAAAWTPEDHVLIVWFTYDEAGGRAHLWWAAEFDLSEDDPDEDL